MLKLGNRDGKVPVQKAPVQKDPGIPQDALPAAESAAPAKATVIGENIAIEGVINAEEDITVEGTLSGGIIAKSHKVTVGTQGRVEADIQAENVAVNGRMKGAIIAFNKVHIGQGADFTGQIKAKSVAVEDGAMLRATIELDKDIREKTLAAPPHRIDAIIFPAEGRGDKSPLREIQQPTSKN